MSSALRDYQAHGALNAGVVRTLSSAPGARVPSYGTALQAYPQQQANPFDFSARAPSYSSAVADIRLKQLAAAAAHNREAMPILTEEPRQDAAAAVAAEPAPRRHVQFFAELPVLPKAYLSESEDGAEMANGCAVKP